MTPELAKAALVFLLRTALKPAEIDTYIAVHRALEALTAPKPRKRATPNPTKVPE